MSDQQSRVETVPSPRVPDLTGWLRKPFVKLVIVALFVIWAHRWSGVPVFQSQVSLEPGWNEFKTKYSLNEFGEDGHFVRAAQNGYNVFFVTYKYAPRFTPRLATDQVNSCASCHTVEQLAYGFVSSDRVDPKLGRRVSFEERVMRCLAKPLDGFIPTLYDPTVRDLRILARAVAHHLQLGEGAPPDMGQRPAGRVR